jgi:hypothetical protein
VGDLVGAGVSEGVSVAVTDDTITCVPVATTIFSLLSHPTSKTIPNTPAKIRKIILIRIFFGFDFPLLTILIQDT